ncbi:MAG: DUF4198 domain-containing protein [Pseudomonadota bacterium]
MKLSVLIAALLAATPAAAHFGMIIPAETMVNQADGRTLPVRLGFAHPFEPDGMEMAAPESVTVTFEGEATDLTETLATIDFHGAQGFETEIDLARPGTYILASTPVPYWEPDEDAFILHYTKTYVSAYDDDSGWDAVLGLKTEIRPLVRPFGIWAGNLFSGQVLVDGAPIPFAEVEVEHYAESPVTAPSELMITQTIVADADGVFHYTPPAAGWWGFAALTPANYRLEQDGEAKDVELGAVIWVRFEGWGAE